MKRLLGKLFGSKPEEAAAPKLRTRAPRVRVPLTDEASFVSHDGKAYPLRNLSETGLALLSPGERFPDGTWGELRVGGERVAVRLTTVRRNGDEAGCVIADGGAGVRALLRRVFSDEFKALEMTEVESKRQKTVEEGEPRWFYAPGNYELFYVSHEGKLVRFEVEWNGNVLAHSKDSGLRFGTVAREGREDVAHARSELIQWAGEVKPEHRQKVLRILENVPGLDGEIRKQLQELLR